MVDRDPFDIRFAGADAAALTALATIMTHAAHNDRHTRDQYGHNCCIRDTQRAGPDRRTQSYRTRAGERFMILE
jgi:hypothetical protein